MTGGAVNDNWAEAKDEEKNIGRSVDHWSMAEKLGLSDS